MANLLPPESKRRLSRLYTARVLAVLSLTLFVLALLTGILLVPSLLALRLAAPPVSASESARDARSASTTEVAQAQAIVRAVAPLLSSRASPVEAIQAVLADKPRGVVVNRITYIHHEGQVLLSGFGARDAINGYRETLLRNGRFSAISLPVSALVGSDDGRFSMTITLRNE